jgi:putative endonuclease
VGAWGAFRAAFAAAFQRLFHARDPGAAHLRLGALGECAAAKHLQSLGYRVLARNLKTARGEADIVCEAPGGDGFVLVEVKSRTVEPGGTGHAPPAEAAVDSAKRARLGGIARHLARANKWPPGNPRIDVVAVDFVGGQVAALRHHQDVVRAGFDGR